MPEILIKKVKSTSGKVKVTNQYVYNSNNHPSKHNQPSQAGVMHLPGLERLKPCRDHAASSYRILYKSYHKDRAICAEQLDRNLYKLMKWRPSLLSDTVSASSNSSKFKKPKNIISNGHVAQALTPPELPLDCDHPVTFLDCAILGSAAPKPFLRPGFMGSLVEDLAPSL